MVIKRAGCWLIMWALAAGSRQQAAGVYVPALLHASRVLWEVGWIPFWIWNFDFIFLSNRKCVLDSFWTTVLFGIFATKQDPIWIYFGFSTFYWKFDIQIITLLLGIPLAKVARPEGPSKVILSTDRQTTFPFSLAITGTMISPRSRRSGELIRATSPKVMTRTFGMRRMARSNERWSRSITKPAEGSYRRLPYIMKHVIQVEVYKLNCLTQGNYQIPLM